MINFLKLHLQRPFQGKFLFLMALKEEAGCEDTLLYVFQSPWRRLLLKKVFALQSSFLKINQVNAGVSSSSLS